MSGLITVTPGTDFGFNSERYALHRSPLVDPQRPEYLVAPCIDYDTYMMDWPLCGIIGGFSPMGFSNIVRAPSYDPFIQASNWTGHMGWQTVSGITRDTNSAVLPSATVILFRTADDLKMDKDISDPNSGAYALHTSDTGTHYVAIFKNGSPNVSGISDNTLVGV
jgi:hypothetical protein